MRRLKGEIPRGFRDGRRVEAIRYKRAIEAERARLNVTVCLSPVLERQYGRCVVDIERLEAVLDVAEARKQRRVARRQLTPLRTQMLTFRAALAELAEQQPSEIARLLTRVK